MDFKQPYKKCIFAAHFLKPEYTSPMVTLSIKNALTATAVGTEVRLRGWVRTFRSNRFIALTDGSTINTIQAVVNFEEFDVALLKRITTGACIEVIGRFNCKFGQRPIVEVQVNGITRSWR